MDTVSLLLYWGKIKVVKNYARDIFLFRIAEGKKENCVRPWSKFSDPFYVWRTTREETSFPWEIYLYLRKERDFKFIWNTNLVKPFLLHKIFLLIIYVARWAIWGLIDYVATLCLRSLTVYDIHSCAHFSQYVARWSVLR